MRRERDGARERRQERGGRGSEEGLRSALRHGQAHNTRKTHIPTTTHQHHNDNTTATQRQHTTAPSLSQVQLARWFERHGGGDRFAYLTHAWLADLFLDCPAALGVACPTAADRAEFEEAVRRGYITWHAAPFNPNYEVFPDESSLAAALAIARRLDARFGFPNKTVASLVRVAGHRQAGRRGFV